MLLVLLALACAPKHATPPPAGAVASAAVAEEVVALDLAGGVRVRVYADHTYTMERDGAVLADHVDAAGLAAIDEGVAETVREAEQGAWAGLTRE